MFCLKSCIHKPRLKDLFLTLVIKPCSLLQYFTVARLKLVMNSTTCRSSIWQMAENCVTFGNFGKFLMH